MKVWKNDILIPRSRYVFRSCSSYCTNFIVTSQLNSWPNCLDQLVLVQPHYIQCTCCDTAADMYNTRPTMHRTHCCTWKWPDIITQICTITALLTLSRYNTMILSVHEYKLVKPTCRTSTAARVDRAAHANSHVLQISCPKYTQTMQHYTHTVKVQHHALSHLLTLCIPHEFEGLELLLTLKCLVSVHFSVQ